MLNTLLSITVLTTASVSPDALACRYISDIDSVLAALYQGQQVESPIAPRSTLLRFDIAYRDSLALLAMAVVKSNKWTAGAAAELDAIDLKLSEVMVEDRDEPAWPLLRGIARQRNPIRQLAGRGDFRKAERLAREQHCGAIASSAAWALGLHSHRRFSGAVHKAILGGSFDYVDGHRAAFDITYFPQVKEEIFPIEGMGRNDLFEALEAYRRVDADSPLASVSRWSIAAMLTEGAVWDSLEVSAGAWRQADSTD